MYCFIQNETPIRGGEDRRLGEGRREEGRRGQRGEGETQEAYWTRDYLLISCSESEWIERVDSIILLQKIFPSFCNFCF